MSGLLTAFEEAVLKCKGECHLNVLDFWSVVRALDAKIELRTIDGVPHEFITAHTPTGPVIVSIDATGKAKRLTP